MRILPTAASAAFIAAVALTTTAAVPAARPRSPVSSAKVSLTRPGAAQVGPIPITGAHPVTADATQVAPRGAFSWPLSPRPAVLRPFDRPADQWSPGHRGARPVGGSGSTGAQRGRWSRGLLRGDRRPWSAHRSTCRRSAHNLRARGRTAGIRHAGSPGHPGWRPLRRARPLRTTRLPPLGSHLRTDLPGSPVTVGFRPTHTPAA